MASERPASEEFRSLATTAVNAIQPTLQILANQWSTDFADTLNQIVVRLQVLADALYERMQREEQQLAQAQTENAAMWALLERIQAAVNPFQTSEPLLQELRAFLAEHPAL